MADDKLYGITVLCEPRVPNAVDLVAVHGLSGHAFHTWEHKATRVMWLKDLLPDELPNARIMTYGYNAKFSNFTGHRELSDISTKLLTDLEDLRQSDEELTRPIIFVCHSLGGAVAKKALLIRKLSDSQLKVQEAVCGVVFLATPHDDSDPATTGKLLANILSAYSPLKKLGTKKSDPRVLYEISSEFRRNTAEKAPDLQLISFYETRKLTSGLFFKRLVVEHNSAILNLPGEDVVSQDADHLQIARFSSKDDLNFRPLLTRLRNLSQMLSSRRGSRAGSVEARSSSAGGSRRRSSMISGDSATLFEVPFAPCETFKGRESVLSKMQEYFSPTDEEKQLTYVLSGLGGCGKTHTALKYAYQNRLKYKNGVFFFNASSKTTLIADFTRISEILKLPQSPNKVEPIKRFFSRAENSDWLFIFDNADDMTSVPLSSYIPRTTRGHLIITTRDETAIGKVSEHGQSIEPLETEEAIQVLLSKAHVGQPTADDVKQAGEIVELLGGLPLAVDQAGAFIRAQRKPLWEYRRLFEDRILEVVKSSPRIDIVENSYLTVWELNFRQTEKNYPMAAKLLLLLSFLEGTDIPESMIRRGCSPKKVWDTNGEVADMTPKDAGLHQELITLVQNEAQFDKAIDQLLAFSLIRLNNFRARGRVFSLHPLVQYCATQRVKIADQRRWRTQAVLLVCQAFPFNTYVDEYFGDKGRDMFPHVPHILKELDTSKDDMQLSTARKRCLCIMLLSASKFSDIRWKREAIERAKGFYEVTDYFLKGWLANAESTVLRLQGDTRASQDALEDHIHHSIGPDLDESLETDARWNAQRGELVLSFAENLLRQNDSARAKVELADWQPLNPAAPSSMEKLVAQSRDVTLGRLLRNEGHFQEALPIFERLLKETGYVAYSSTGWQLVMFNNVSDLYCEVGRPLDAEAAIEQQLKLVYARKWENITTGRRLQLALVESLIRRGEFRAAEACLGKLMPIFETDEEAGELQNTNHFLTWTCLARISQMEGRWEQALICWNRAFGIIEKYGWEKTFNNAVVLFSIAQVLYRTGRIEEATINLQNAEATLKLEGRRYWIVGLGSYWFDYVRVPLGETGPNWVVFEPSSQRNIDDGHTSAEEMFSLLNNPPDASSHLSKVMTASKSNPTGTTLLGSTGRSITAPELRSRKDWGHLKLLDNEGGQNIRSASEPDMQLKLPKQGGMSEALNTSTVVGGKLDDNTFQSKMWFGFFQSVFEFLDASGIQSWEDTDLPVKIAVLDTGVNIVDPFIRLHRDRIECTSFIDSGDTGDTAGHGTYIVGLLLKIARNATIYVAKVVENATDEPDAVAIAEAIDYARTDWEVDIVSMSFGFTQPSEPMRQAIERAHSANIIMFAASHNDGGNRPIQFPANSTNVIAIGATNSHGKDSGFSPLTGSRQHYFSTFGENVVSLGKLKSGTSYATPIAAGIAALTMDYVNYLTDFEFYPPASRGKTDDELKQMLEDRREITKRIKTLDGMTRVLRRLSVDSSSYQYLSPWTLLDIRQRDEVPSILLNCLRGLR